MVRKRIKKLEIKGLTKTLKNEPAFTKHEKGKRNLERPGIQIPGYEDHVVVLDQQSLEGAKKNSQKKAKEASAEAKARVEKMKKQERRDQWETHKREKIVRESKITFMKLSIGWKLLFGSFLIVSGIMSLYTVIRLLSDPTSFDTPTQRYYLDGGFEQVIIYFCIFAGLAILRYVLKRLEDEIIRCENEVIDNLRNGHPIDHATVQRERQFNRIYWVLNHLFGFGLITGFLFIFMREYALLFGLFIYLLLNLFRFLTRDASKEYEEDERRSRRSA